MRASTWTALVSGAALLTAAALGCVAMRPPLERFTAETDAVHRTTCATYNGYTMGMLGLFLTFSNALLLDHLADPSKKQGVIDLLSAVDAAVSQEDAVTLVVTYMLAYSTDEKAKKALLATEYLEAALEVKDTLGCK